MRISTTLLMASMMACTISLSSAQATEKEFHINNHGIHTGHSDKEHIHNDYAPISVMGSHMHKAGDFMFSYRAMHMNMDGNRTGTNRIGLTTIATTKPNIFSNIAGQPPTLRVVPTDMTMDMHMLSAMYAPTDWLTLMIMNNYLKKEMNHITFAGASGTSILGNFSTKSEGWGDTKVTGLFKIFENSTHHFHLNIGLSIPTGSINETDTVLAPNGTTPNLRLPYAMQLGTGTYDFLPGITYIGSRDSWSWGAQYTGEIRLESKNSEGYAWGDKHSLTTWVAYKWAPWISTSARFTGSTQSSIDGIDSKIIAPVQTANPDNYGGNILEYGLGINLTGTKAYLKNHRLAFEVTAPLYRDLKGVQLENDWAVTIGWQYSF